MTSLPFISAPMTVRPEWIDFNGHLNMAYYSVLIDECGMQAYSELGFGPDYLKETGCTTYAAEFHVKYLRELHEGDQVVGHYQLLDFDGKAIHTYSELWHVDGWLAATAENLTLHIDQSGPRVAMMNPEMFARVDAVFQKHKTIPRPKGVGNPIGIRRKG